jgi:hypothetical protein
MAKLVVDLHAMARDGRGIDAELARALDEAEARRIRTAESSPARAAAS